MAKDDSFYCVLASLTPDLGECRDITGCPLVRRKPQRVAVDGMTPAQRRGLAAEQRAGPREAVAASRAVLDDVLRI